MQISTYHEARTYLESFIRTTITERIEADSALPHPLQRMQELLTLLGNPQNTFRSIQVSGTAGKGSTSYLLSHILSTAGYKTGLTLSPHLQKLNERIRINNQEIDDTSFISLLNAVIPSIQKLSQTAYGQPSYFEILIGMAFTHFARENVDIAIIEVGLEGKLDGTNTLMPIIAVLTNIDLDHVEILGETVEEIAHEAVSIIKAVPDHAQQVVSSVSQTSIRKIVEEKSRTEGVQLSQQGSDFTYRIREVDRSGSRFDFISGEDSYEDIELSLLGEYQVENAAIALEVIRQSERFGYTVSEDHIRKALSTASFPGRFEILPYTKGGTLYTFVLDGAHNPLKMHSFLSALESFYPEKKKIFIVTFKRGKAVETMLHAIERIADVLVLTEFHRTIDTGKNASMMSDDLRAVEHNLSERKDIPIYTAKTTAEALTLALQEAHSDDLMIVTGSLYLIGEVKDLL